MGCCGGGVVVTLHALNSENLSSKSNVKIVNNTKKKMNEKEASVDPYKISRKSYGIPLVQMSGTFIILSNFSSTTSF